MMRITRIAAMQLRLSFQNKSTLFTAFILPVLFTVFFSSVFTSMGNEFPIYIDDQDKSEYSSRLIELIEESNTYSVNEISESKINDKINDRYIEVGFVIPNGFGEEVKDGKKSSLKVIRVKNSNEAGTIHTVTGFIQKLQNTVKVANLSIDMVKDNTVTSEADIKEWHKKVYDEANKQWKYPKVSTSFEYMTREVQSNVNGDSIQASIGYLALFLCFTIVFGVGSILNEKEEGTLKKLLISPSSTREIMIGKYTGTFLMGLIQVSVLILFGIFIIKVNWFNNPTLIIVLLLAYLYALVSLGMLLVGIVKNFTQLNVIGTILIMGTGMIGGTWWSIEMAPKWMQLLSKFTPQGWFMVGAIDIIKNGATISQVLKPIGVLVLMGSIGLLIALKFINFKRILEFE